jgi:hypothetical protein
MGAKVLPNTGEPFSIRLFADNRELFTGSLKNDKKTPVKIPIIIGIVSKYNLFIISN